MIQSKVESLRDAHVSLKNDVKQCESKWNALDEQINRLIIERSQVASLIELSEKEMNYIEMELRPYGGVSE